MSVPASIDAVDVALRDGSTVRVRPVRPDDAEALRELLGGLSESSRWFRFLSAAVDIDKVSRFAAAATNGAGLVVIAGSPERVIAHGMYVRESDSRAEVAFEV